MNHTNVLVTTMLCVAVMAGACDESEQIEQIEQTDANVSAQAPGQALPLQAPTADLPEAQAQAATVLGVETVDVTIPAALHAQGLALPAKLVRPKWSKPVGDKPAMLVLHGSGGLLKMLKGKSDKPCSDEMENQFTEWSDRLARLGYTVLLPSSYSARGFCDKHKDAARMPKTFDDKPEQIVSRLYDVDASARYLCDQPGVDCERMGVLGFSQGGTMVMLALHWQIEEALAYFRKHLAKDFDIEVPEVKPGRPEFTMGIAYYPGCGFDGVVPLTTNKGGEVHDKFSPTAPLTILHGSNDALIKECSTQYGPGGRQIQAKQVADQLAIDDTYEITVYPGAAHSFDSAASKGADAAARDAALKVALDKLATQL
jgi:dienelactone hydrolase